MGVPDLMRFVARDAPGALNRLPRANKAPPIAFDYVLVDVSNALQTLQSEDLQRLLVSDVLATKAVVLVLDGQRQRQGTVREQRQFLQQREGDIMVQQLAVALLGTSQDARRGGRVIVVGREIVGEGDYKLLSVHRRLHAAHHAKKAAVGSSPRFLFISEDSDVLCGALLGPEPEQVSIATNLHGALHEVNLLEVGAILRRVFATSGMVTFIEKHPRIATNSTSAAMAAGPRKTFDDDDDEPSARAPNGGNQGPVRRVKTTPTQLGVQSAALDFIFLFSLVLGTSTTPSITRGATRVDIAACWAHYAELMRGRRKLIQGSTAQGPLLRIAPDDTSADTVVLDAELLATILEARFADEVSHIPTPDERKYAREYVKHVVKSVMDLATGAPNDTRGDAGKFAKPPSLACFTSVLGLHDERAYEIKFDFSLRPIVINQRESKEEETQPIKRVLAFFDRESVRLGIPTHPTAPFFWPPHEARPISGSSGVHKAEVALPLGTTPVALTVPLATLMSSYGASLIDATFCTVKDVVVADESGRANPNESVVFDFDMRRMVPSKTSTSVVDESQRQAAKQRILAAAGLSVSYFTASAPAQATTAAAAVAVDMDLPSDKRNKLVARAAKAAKLAAGGNTSGAKVTNAVQPTSKVTKAVAVEEKATPTDASVAAPKKQKRLGKRERAQKAKRDKKTPR